MTQSSSHPSIEPWQLTAYALNELEPSDSAKVELALETNVALRGEFEQIQQTLTAVRTAFASTAATVGLSDSQTAIISSQFEQTAAPNVGAVGGVPPVATIKLAGRPFYRRKRFAALLATAAAIPLAATWMPSLYENGGPFVYNEGIRPSNSFSQLAKVTETAKHNSSIVLSTKAESPESAVGKDSNRADTPASSESKYLPIGDLAEEGREKVNTSGDAVASESQLGDVDVSYVPEMGLAIVKGNKQEVEKAQQASAGIGGKNEIASASEIDAAERRLHYSDSFANETIDEKVASPARNRILLGVIDPSKLSATPRIVIPEEEVEVLGLAKEETKSSLGSAVGKAIVGGPSTGKTGSMGYAMGSGMSAVPAGPMQMNATASASLLARDNARDEYMKATESTATLDIGLTESASQSAPYPLPVELRQNAPHLFRAPASEPSGTDRFEKIVETPFLETQKAPLSTFSIDVDTASYSKIRQTIMEGNRLPSPNMVRIEEMVNYFEYGYAGPQDERPFAAHMSVDRCPWNTEHQLVRVGLQAKKIDKDKRVKANIVFLLDVSGSMNEPNKLPLVKKSLSMMVNQLNENDRVAIVVYAGAAGCVLPSTCGAEKQAILSSLDHLNAGGSTNGGQGIQLAYSIAKEHFIPGGANRVVLCTDGDFNVGVTGDDALVAMMQENAKSNIFLTCLGFGAGNYNDTMMEKISNKGNGIYGMIDNELEGRRMMVEQLGGTLVTVAKDVKIQVDFNPAKIAGYRLIGYEDRRLANKDFDNDQKDAGEIGAGHRVTALYEVIPTDKWVGTVPPSEGETSKYLKNSKPDNNAQASTTAEFPAELLTLKVRYKEPEGSVSTKQEFVLKDTDRVEQPLVDRDMQWATSVAEFGLLLRRSEMAPHADWTEMLERAASSAGGDPYRLECLAMMRKARSMFR
jgi:secreted protein with Ig-like and vWFA domain